MVTIAKNKSKKNGLLGFSTGAFIFTAISILVITVAVTNITNLCTKAGAGRNASTQLFDEKQTETPQEKQKQIAYAVFVECSTQQSVSAANVLLHSVHQISSRNPTSGSKYDYKMYALVHPQAEDCAQELIHLGYTVIIANTRRNGKDVQGGSLRKNTNGEWCCGSENLITLYSINMSEHSLVVHLNVDFVIEKPLDTLFDAIFSKVSRKQQTLPSQSTEALVQLQYPKYNLSIYSKIYQGCFHYLLDQFRL